MLRFCAGTCSAIPGWAGLANLGYLSMRIASCFLLPSLALNSRIRDPFTLCLLGLEASVCDTKARIKKMRLYKKKKRSINKVKQDNTIVGKSVVRLYSLHIT